MKVIDRAITPDGINIQLEDWSEYNSEKYPNLYGLSITAYPVAQRTGKNRIIEGGKKFRLTIEFNPYANYLNHDVKADYEGLKSGVKSLEDLATHFWNGEKDMWYLGMDVKNYGY